MTVLGLDLGSRAVKLAVMEGETVVRRAKIDTVDFYRNCCTYDGRLRADLDKLGVGPVDRCVSTGYGQNNTDLENFTAINEIKAHVYGALFQTGASDFTLLDIGGQDIKAVRVEKGIVTDLALNEKCAASSGRYLENMAAVLALPLEELSRCHADPVTLSSTCAVFAESALIGLIAQGIPAERLCAGVNRSLYERLRPLIGQVGGCVRLVLSGGVAQNEALRFYLKQDFDEVTVLDDPQFNGAIGCCRFASRNQFKK